MRAGTIIWSSRSHLPSWSRASTRSGVAVSQGPDGVEVQVTDNGPGVPQDLREKVFQRFYRMERSRSTPGTGLGLSLVAAIAKLHRARIALSDNNPGLRVELIFPATYKTA
jgi:signal transduction histidine kinase